MYLWVTIKQNLTHLQVIVNIKLYQGISLQNTEVSFLSILLMYLSDSVWQPEACMRALHVGIFIALCLSLQKI